MYCEECGNIVSENARFCRSCGAQIRQVEIVARGSGNRPDNSNATVTQFQGTQKPVMDSFDKTAEDVVLKENDVSDGLHPWRRFWARIIDVFGFGTIYALVVLLLIDTLFEGVIDRLMDYEFIDFIFLFIVYVLWLPIEALLIAHFSSTPGKWLYGIKIRKSDGGHLPFSDSLKRAFNVWTVGEAMSIPPFPLFTRLIAYWQLKKSGETWWDKASRAKVIHKRLGVVRKISCTIVVIFLMFLYSVFFAIT